MDGERERKITVTAIERFSAKDGPGIRTVVFFKGCPLRCAWCHNPETQAAEPELLFDAAACIGCGACVSVCPVGARTEKFPFPDRGKCMGCGRCGEVCPSGASALSGRPMTAEEIVEEACRDEIFYAGGGGLTLSGGEPFFWEATEEVLAKAASKGLSVVAETSGYAPSARLERAAAYVGLFLWDVKDTDGARHRLYTGGELGVVLENLRRVDARGGATLIRCPMAEGINADEKNLRGLAELSLSLKHCFGVQLLACHDGGRTKNRLLGRTDGARREWTPSAQNFESYGRILRGFGARVWEEGSFPPALPAERR